MKTEFKIKKKELKPQMNKKTIYAAQVFLMTINILKMKQPSGHEYQVSLVII